MGSTGELLLSGRVPGGDKLPGGRTCGASCSGGKHRDGLVGYIDTHHPAIRKIFSIYIHTTHF